MQNLFQNCLHIVPMDTGSSVSHAGKAAGAVFYMFFDHPDLFDLLGGCLLHSSQKCSGYVHGIASFPLGRAVKNQYTRHFYPFSFVCYSAYDVSISFHFSSVNHFSRAQTFSDIHSSLNILRSAIPAYKEPLVRQLYYLPRLEKI